jgi:thiol-disulfide isomerase/thioredoxin
VAPIRAWTGKSTPALALSDLAGRPIDLRDFRGRVVLVNFWATWCEPCRDEMPAIARLRDQLKGQPFEVLTVNYGESNAKVAAFLQKEKLDVPVLLDPDKAAAERWNAKGLPMTFLVDARGRVRYWVFGERDWSEGEALKHVEKLMAEAGVARR